MGILIVGDIQAKREQPYWTGTQLLMEWLLDNYKEHILITPGDLYEHSTPHADVETKMIEYLLQFKESHIVLGNHDYSKNKGSALEHLPLHKNIYVYNDVSEINIDNLNCLMLPYSYTEQKMLDYKDIQGEYDLIFTHCTPEVESFGGSYVEINAKANIGIFWGHIHTPKNYKDKNINYIIGTPQPTKMGEHLFSPRCFLIENSIVEEIQLPIFMTIKDIEFGEEITEKNYLYNIKNVPSYNTMYEKYKGFHIRETGVTIKKDEIEESIDLNFEENPLPVLFNNWIVEEEIEIEEQLKKTTLHFLNK